MPFPLSRDRAESLGVSVAESIAFHTPEQFAFRQAAAAKAYAEVQAREGFKITEAVEALAAFAALPLAVAVAPATAALATTGIATARKLAAGDYLGAATTLAPVALPTSLQPYVAPAVSVARGDYLSAGLALAKQSGFQLPALPGGGSMPFSISDFAKTVKTGAAFLGDILAPAVSMSPLGQLFPGPTGYGGGSARPGLPTVAPTMDVSRRYLLRAGEAGFPGELGAPGVMSTSQPFSFTAPLTRTRAGTAPGTAMASAMSQYQGLRVAPSVSGAPGFAVGAGGATAAQMATAQQKAVMEHVHATVPGIRLREIGTLIGKFGLQAIAGFLQITVDEVLFLFMRWTRRRFRHHRRGISWHQIANAKRTMHLLGSMSHRFHGGGGRRRRRSFRR